MRSALLLAGLFSVMTITPALAQEPEYSRTLDEQLARVRAGKTPVPKVGEKVEPFEPNASISKENVTTNSEGAEVVERNWQDLRTTETNVAGQAPADLGNLAPAAGNVANAPSAPAPAPAPAKEVIHSVGGGAIPALPLDVVTLPTGIKYITGGVGEEEVAQLKSVDMEYNVQLLIAASGGAFQSGATVRVTDSEGREEIFAENCGPYFYALLPEGTHHLEVTTAAGNKQTVKVAASKTIKKPVARFKE